MKQDKGIKKRIVATGALVVTTGLKLCLEQRLWSFEVKYKNGTKRWFLAHELKDI